MKINQTSSSSSSLAEQLLSHAQSEREVVQDFCALATSLEWELGQDYLRARGNKAFISDASPVPHVVNNDGTLSRNAAEVFFTSLLEAEKAGTLENDIFVLELGIGVGLFARFFLDHVKVLSLQHKKDFYNRICYVAADRSERMLLDVLRHGVLGNHVGRYMVRCVDAMKPEEKLPGDVRMRGKGRGARGESGIRSQESGVGDHAASLANASGSHPRPSPLLPLAPPFRAVFLNYLLDCLPAAVLDMNGDEVKQLCVRTCVARNVKLSDHTDMTVKQLQERARSNSPRARQELLEVYGLFASEYDYRPVAVSDLPYGAFALDYGRRLSRRLLHSYGAIQSLEKLLNLVADDGFILVNDYGPTQTTRDDEFEHQRFSLATFVGVNFSELRAYFGEQGKCQYLEPAGGEERGIHSRLFGRQVHPETAARFYQRFSDDAHKQLQEPIEKARLCAKSGRFELAANYYQEALERQPKNWVLLNEVSMFLTFQMHKPKVGIDMAKLALKENPTCSAELWNTLGDGLYAHGRVTEARGAYQKAMAVNAGDVRSRYNLAWVHAHQRDYAAALARLAEALALDKTGEYRERLMAKMNEVLQQVTVRHQQEYLQMINLVSRQRQRKDAEPKQTEE